MALYALGDLHLGFQVRKPMEVFGKVWRYHERKIEKYVNKIVSPEDTLVLTGDHSWGRKLEECREDLEFIERLPGRKILLRGNHDMFWDAKKTKSLNEKFDGRLFFFRIILRPIRIMRWWERKASRLRDRFIWTVGEI